MKKLLFLFIGILVISDALAQTDTNPAPQTVFEGLHKNIFVEGLGAGFMGSVNFDMRLQRGRMDGIGFRVGIGGALAGATFDDPSTSYEYGNTFFMFQQQERANIVTFPMGVNYLVGKRRSNFLAGLGIIPAYISVPTKNIESFALGGGYISLGYRFQPLRHGIMFQINWNPLILRGSGFNPGWFGIGIGYGFK